jgi:hypothetical protein
MERTGSKPFRLIFRVHRGRSGKRHREAVPEKILMTAYQTQSDRPLKGLSAGFLLDLMEVIVYGGSYFLIVIGVPRSPA